MNLLAIDTVADLCAACLYDGTGRNVLAYQEEEIGRGHAERLFPVIELALHQADLSFDRLDRLAVCVGPGSFTGVRVGVSAMRGLAVALDIPLIGINVFDCLARSVVGDQPVLVTIDARRDEIYTQLFAPGGTAVSTPQVLSPEDALALALNHGAALAGSGVCALRSSAADPTHIPRILSESASVDLACLAEIAAQSEPPARRPVPLYLRAPDAKPQSGFALPRRKAAS